MMIYIPKVSGNRFDAIAEAFLSTKAAVELNWLIVTPAQSCISSNVSILCPFISEQIGNLILILDSEIKTKY